MHLGVGFSHWYGDTFGAPVGFTTPGLNFSIQPGLSWLEVTAAYSLSVAGLPLPDGSKGVVGFGLVGASLVRELRMNNQRLGIAGGPVVGLVHTPGGAGIAMGARLAARYLIKVSQLISIGPSFEGRGVLYLLPGSNRPLYAITNGSLVAGHSDVQVDLSVLVAFW